MLESVRATIYLLGVVAVTEIATVVVVIIIIKP